MTLIYLTPDMVCGMDGEFKTVTECPETSADDAPTQCDVTDDVTNALDLTCPNKVDNRVTSQMGNFSPRRSRAGSLEEKTYVCDYELCEYKTKYKNAMKRHIETQHLALVHHVCPVCHKSFKHQDNLSKHVKIHKKNENCPLCKRVFALKQQLRQHLTNKHSVDPDIYLRNKSQAKVRAIRPDSFQASFDMFIEKYTNQVKKSDKESPNLLPVMETPAPTPIPEVSMETESDVLATPSSAPSAAFPNPQSVSISQMVSSAISESIVREAVLQNPNLSLQQDPDVQDGLLVEFTTDVEAMRAAQLPLNLSLNQELKHSSAPKIFQCSACDYQTRKKAHMRRHSLSVHAAVKPYACYICGQGFTRTEKIKRHFMRIHPGEVYDCQRLKMQTEPTVIVSDSSLSDGGGSSPLMTSSSDDLDEGRLPYEPSCSSADGEAGQQLSLNLIDPQKDFECVHCDYSTNREDHLHTHMQMHGDLACPHCSFSSTDLEAYMYHLKGCLRHLRRDVNALTCEYCNDTIGHPSEMISHFLFVHGIQVFQCEFCTYTTDNRDAFLYHYDCHQNDLSSTWDSGCSEIDPVDLYTCSMCSFQTRYRFIMKNHTGFHTGNTIQCSAHGCSFVSMLSMSLEVHHQVSHSPHDFKPHDYSFISCSQHSGHLKSQLNSHRCGSCFLTFNSLLSLREHLSNCEMSHLEKSVYGSEKGIECVDITIQEY